MLQHPYSYRASPPLQVLPYSPWINDLWRYERPSLPYTPEASKSKPSPPITTPATTLPHTRPLRSILKHPRSTPIEPRRKKFVHFHPMTASPPLAAPGTYKHTGRPKSPRSRHPARFHPCLVSTLQQPVKEAQATASDTPSATLQRVKQASRTASQLGVQLRPTENIARPRPPTPPPAAFFHSPHNAQAQANPRAQRLPQQPNTSVPRQPIPAPQPSTPKRTILEAQTPAIRWPNGRNAEYSNTDIRLAESATVVLKKPDIKVSDAAATARKVEATRRSLRALARDFDRKNAWRRGSG
jgi:hypothetical protein